MQVSNNYEKGIYNGDVGVIKLVSTEKKRLQVDFQGLLVDYYENEFDQLKHAFATTVHKVQGGEYPVVIMVVTNYHSMMLLRNLLYIKLFAVHPHYPSALFTGVLQVHATSFKRLRLLNLFGIHVDDR